MLVFKYALTAYDNNPVEKNMHCH